MNNINIPYPRTFLPKQKEVFDAVIKKKKKYVLYSGAFAAGKTLLMCHLVIRFCIQNKRSLWFFGAQTVPNLRDTVIRTFLEEIDLYQKTINDKRKELPEDQQHLLNIKLTHSYRPSIMTFKFFNNSEVLFRSCDEPSKFKSLNLDGFAIDEPVDISEDVFFMLQGRLRGKHAPLRVGIMAGNPSGKANWVYQKFFENENKEYYVVQTSTYDNVYLPKDYIVDCEKSYDEDYARRYLRGEWGSFEGQVFKDFSIDRHVGNFSSDRYKYYICGIDSGFRNPTSILSIGVDNDRNLFIVEEFYEKEKTTSEVAEYANEMEKRYNFHRIYVDPSAANLIEILRQKKIKAECGDNELDAGIAKLKTFFKHNIIHIDKSCKNLIKELESYRYGKDSFEKNLTEKPIKSDDHAIDSLRYSVTGFNPFKSPTLCKGGNW